MGRKKSNLWSRILALMLVVMLVPISQAGPVFAKQTNRAAAKKEYATRADVITAIDQMVGATKVTKKIHEVKDVKKTDAYYRKMAAAMRAGLIAPTKAGKLGPNLKATYNYAAVVLARATGLSKKEILGNKNAGSRITKTQLTSWLNTVAPNVISKSASKVKEGNVVINKPGVTLKDVTVKGALVIGDGVGDGEVTLENVTVTGKTVIRGGGENSIIIKGTTKLSDVVVKQVYNAVSLKIEDSAVVSNVSVEQNSKDIKIVGAVKNLLVKGSDLNVNLESAVIENVTVKENAERVSIIIHKESAVTNLVIQAKDVKVSGEGKAESIQIEADNVSVNMDNIDASAVTVKDGVQNAVVNGEEKDSGQKKPDDKKPETEPSGGSASSSPSVITPPTSGGASTDPLAGYTLKWEDNFDGDSLNTANWNYEAHDPGWVNEEWQKYVSEEENKTSGNIAVKDGNLIIQAKKTEVGKDENGNPKYEYTSGRINTQNKQDYKYGRFEARLKVPSGKGFLPAFWMMPTDESLYGQWPKCGEIDIMEVMGQETNKLMSTLHFGEPHTQKQKAYELSGDTFADSFHVFACEWEPGEMRFYVDGILYHTENDWFTKKTGYGEITYPAPYDQPFYLILNLAVGGSWVGYPDETTGFGDNAQLVVDYVKVYQKDSYDENVQKPEAGNITLREPDATGNYVINGDFAQAESLNDEKDWAVMFAEGGDGKATISDNALHIETTAAGAVDYSVQVVQPQIPLEKGQKYRLSFDAYADEARTIKTGISAPDLNYSRYFDDTTVELKTEKQKYAYEFNMYSNSDANARVEFNLGNQGSTAAVHISNVRLEKIGAADEVKKSVLPDGNYVYNGGFEEGADRLDYWTVDKKDGAQAAVTNSNNQRELEVKTSADGQVVVSQDVAVQGGKDYMLMFDAYGTAPITVTVAGKTYTYNLTAEKQTLKETFTADGASVLSFAFGAGAAYIDNVRIQEDGLLLNGDFSSGMVGYEVFADASASASGSIDDLTEGGAFCMDIANTGDAEWKVQLKQNDVTLEKDKYYEFSFRAKSDLARKIMCAFQRDGSTHKTADGAEDWTPYLQETLELGNEYKEYTYKFQMKYDTDPETILTFSMGAVGGTQIAQKHRVVLDDLELKEISEEEMPPVEPVPEGENLLKNGNFATGGDGWYLYVHKDVNADASVEYRDNSATVEIKNIGTDGWHVQLQNQEAFKLEKGAEYELTYKALSTNDWTVKTDCMLGDDNWYCGGAVSFEAGKEKTVKVDLKVDDDPKKETSDQIKFKVSLGNIQDVASATGKNVKAEDSAVSTTITLSDFVLVKKGEEPKPDDSEVGTTITLSDFVLEKTGGDGMNLLTDGNFSNSGENWNLLEDQEGSKASVKYDSGKAIVTISNIGTADWHVQLQNTAAFTLEKDASYKLTYKAKAENDWAIKTAFMGPSDSWYGGNVKSLKAGEEQTVTVEFTVDKETSDHINLKLSMGKMTGDDVKGQTGGNVK